MIARRGGRGRQKPVRAQHDLFGQRQFERLREQIRKLGEQRAAVLRSETKKYFRYEAVFELAESKHQDGAPEVRIDTAGIARNVGFEFKGVQRYRLMLQETLRIGESCQPPFYIARYSYAIHDANTGDRLFRFEYHPDLKEGNDPYALIHHLHVGPGYSRLDRLHFPLWPFIQQDDPHKVLAIVLEWCREELRRIGAPPSEADEAS